MADELNLKALRDEISKQGVHPDITALAVFALRQIERVEGCLDCVGAGYIKYAHGAIPCRFCSHLRTDLLALQREVPTQ